MLIDALNEMHSFPKQVQIHHLMVVINKFNHHTNWQIDQQSTYKFIK